MNIFSGLRFRSFQLYKSGLLGLLMVRGQGVLFVLVARLDSPIPTSQDIDRLLPTRPLHRVKILAGDGIDDMVAA
jgi:hypothetical protein